jgi:LysM repeat protein
VWCALDAGCAGPSKVSRGFDERVNQLYVDSPTLGQLAWPVEVAGTAVTKVVDWCAVNPWYFWGDVFEGQGTPYNYHSPIAPEPAPDAKKGAAPGDEAHGGTGTENSGELLSISDPDTTTYDLSPGRSYAPSSSSYSPPNATMSRPKAAAQPSRALAAIDDAPEPRASAKSTPARSTTAKSSTARQHTVKRGDTLSGLAQKYYGDAEKWQPIYQANRKTLKSPKDVKPGQVLTIPAKK